MDDFADTMMINASADSLHLCLASRSRYRQALLSRLQVPFTTAPADIDESPLPDEPASQTATRLAQAKARTILLQQNSRNILIIGSDQIACLNGRAFGKPGNHTAALAQLQAMRGREVIFYTAVCLLDSRTEHVQSKLVITTVQMRNASDEELQVYLQREQPYDCAGSAQVEGLGIALIERIQTEDPTALIGLPLITLTGFLRQAGYPLLRSQS
jgi:septum formation protein